MILTEQNITYISKNLELYGLKNPELKEDILDHICTYLENTEEINFNQAYQTVIQKFGGYLNIQRIQTETNLQLYSKSAIYRSRILFIMGFVSTILITTGILFKITQWPYSGKILVSGFAVLIVATLPIYFYSKYKDKSIKYQSQYDH